MMMRNTKIISSLIATQLMQCGERIDENLWVSHNSLIGTLRIQWKNIVGNIELFLLLDFVVCIQNLHGKVASPYI
jgi:hypothetical protein